MANISYESPTEGCNLMRKLLHRSILLLERSAMRPLFNCLMNFMASVAAAANLVVDVAREQQNIDGMGVNINVNSWKNGELKPALDALIDLTAAPHFV